MDPLPIEDGSPCRNRMKKKPFTLFELLVTSIIIFVVFVIVLVVGGLLIGGCIIAKKAKDEGLKPSIERVWEGPEEEAEKSPDKAQ